MYYVIKLNIQLVYANAYPIYCNIRAKLVEVIKKMQINFTTYLHLLTKQFAYVLYYILLFSRLHFLQSI
jgi:hypothetical protein